MISDQLKDISYYNANKKKFNRNYNTIWKGIAGPKYIGLCSYLFQQFYKKWELKHNVLEEMPTMEEFAHFYFTYTNPIKSKRIKRDDSMYYGRSVDELTRLAQVYMERINNEKIGLEQCFDDIVCHAIVETFTGQIREVLIIREYEENGYKAEHTYGKWDKDLGVDFIIRKDDEIKGYIQIKPHTTFASTKNRSLIEDRIEFFHKEEMKKEECLKNDMPYYPTKIIIYNNEVPGKWCSKNGKRGFYLEELIDRSGRALIDINNFDYV
jgi:hypothetical protein